jgi:hypothetical protein
MIGLKFFFNQTIGKIQFNMKSEAGCKSTESIYLIVIIYLINSKLSRKRINLYLLIPFLIYIVIFYWTKLCLDFQFIEAPLGSILGPF